MLDHQLITENLKGSVFATITQISLRTGLYPGILTLERVRFETEPIASGAFGDILKGFFGFYPICLKVARVSQSKNTRDLISVRSEFVETIIRWLSTVTLCRQSRKKHSRLAH